VTAPDPSGTAPRTPLAPAGSTAWKRREPATPWRAARGGCQASTAVCCVMVFATEGRGRSHEFLRVVILQTPRGQSGWPWIVARRLAGRALSSVGSCGSRSAEAVLRLAVSWPWAMPWVAVRGLQVHVLKQMPWKAPCLAGVQDHPQRLSGNARDSAGLSGRRRRTRRRVGSCVNGRGIFGITNRPMLTDTGQAPDPSLAPLETAAVRTKPPVIGFPFSFRAGPSAPDGWFSVAIAGWAAAAVTLLGVTILPLEVAGPCMVNSPELRDNAVPHT